MVTASKFEEYFGTPIYEHFGNDGPFGDDRRISMTTTRTAYTTSSNDQCTLKRQNRVKKRKPSELRERTSPNGNPLFQLWK